jgi:hypothetical protein
MMLPLTPLQKLVAYSSLALVLIVTAFGLFAIWVIVTES